MIGFVFESQSNTPLPVTDIRLIFYLVCGVAVAFYLKHKERRQGRRQRYYKDSMRYAVPGWGIMLGLTYLGVGMFGREYFVIEGAGDLPRSESYMAGAIIGGALFGAFCAFSIGWVLYIWFGEPLPKE